MFSQGLLLGDIFFRPGRCAPVKAQRQQVSKASSPAAELRRPHCKQDECTSSSVQYEALVILFQETHCTCADKLTISGFALAGSSLSRKHGLAMFVLDRLKWALVDQSPTTSQIEWLWVDVDG